jgi:hypothetical protein
MRKGLLYQEATPLKYLLSLRTGVSAWAGLLASAHQLFSLSGKPSDVLEKLSLYSDGTVQDFHLLPF